MQRSRAEPATSRGHALWVRICHWLLAASVLTLAVSGVYILMVHPRLYWGEVGNDLTPAWLDLPISANHRPEGWQRTVTFDAIDGSPISASRTYETFNENGWARSLHFLAGWILVAVGALYAALGVATGHIARDLAPRGARASARAVGTGSYGLLQRYAYVGVAFVVLPLMVLAGLAMSPQISAALPLLHDVFGGQQSARTLHFLGFVVLAAFVVGHVVMVLARGARRQMRAMILGKPT
jgi:thiosulfate reductase cytochrome b subunit